METLLSVKNLKVDFDHRGGGVSAVRDVSFDIGRRETVAIVGESGSGKSVTALALTRLLPEPPVCRMEGEVWYRGQNVLCLKGKALRDVRGRGLAYIFQDPGTSLNPVFTVGAQIAEAVKRHCPEVSEVRHHVVGLLERVGIEAEGYRSYPHELSGGMQQRIMIAMALACRPKILIADEPTTALDVTIQKQIMDLLTDLQQKEETSILLITHNFGIVKGFANRILVMFRGKIVEQGTAEEVIEAPRHPYTKALVACIPRIGDRQSRLATIDYSQIS